MNKKRIYIISSTLLLIGLFAGVVQYVGMFDALYAAAVNPGHSWSQMECNTTLCVNTKVGIGTTNPQASLDVAGSYRIGSDYVYGNTFTDSRDGNVYETIVIDGKTWMLEDMRYLPEVSPPSGTYYSTPKYNVFGYFGTSVSEAKANLRDYGVFYNIAAVKSTTNPVCPSGWHVSTDAEWYALESKFSPPYYCPANGTSASWSCNGAGDGIRKLLKLNFPGFPNGDYFLYAGQYHYIWFLDVSGNAHFRTFASTSVDNYSNYSGIVKSSQTGAYSNSVRCVKN